MNELPLVGSTKPLEIKKLLSCIIMLCEIVEAISKFGKIALFITTLEFVYPRLSKGGYVFIHDYNSPESNWACYRAVSEFLKDKVEIVISIPDAWGTCLFVKL